MAENFDVNIIDVKEPANGALGAACPTVLRQIVSSISDVPILSFSAGELIDWQNLPLAGVSTRYPQDLLVSFKFVKVGLASMRNRNWQTAWLSLFEDLPSNASPVAVAYLDQLIADSPTPIDVVDFALSHPQCSTVLFDTYDKSNNLFHWIDIDELSDLIGATQSRGRQAVIAGSVDSACLDRVLRAKPDFIGIRGAVCRANRESDIDPTLVKQWIDALPQETL